MEIINIDTIINKLQSLNNKMDNLILNNSIINEKLIEYDEDDNIIKDDEFINDSEYLYDLNIIDNIQILDFSISNFDNSYNYISLSDEKDIIQSLYLELKKKKHSYYNLYYIVNDVIFKYINSITYKSPMLNRSTCDVDLKILEKYVLKYINKYFVDDNVNNLIHDLLLLNNKILMFLNSVQLN